MTRRCSSLPRAWGHHPDRGRPWSRTGRRRRRYHLERRPEWWWTAGAAVGLRTTADPRCRPRWVSRNESRRRWTGARGSRIEAGPKAETMPIPPPWASLRRRPVHTRGLGRCLSPPMVRQRRSWTGLLVRMYPARCIRAPYIPHPCASHPVARRLGAPDSAAAERSGWTWSGDATGYLENGDAPSAPATTHRKHQHYEFDHERRVRALQGGTHSRRRRVHLQLRVHVLSRLRRGYGAPMSELRRGAGPASPR